MKINVCDICFRKDKKLQESKYRISIRGGKGISIDVCEKHKHSAPKNITELLKFIYSPDGLAITDVDAKRILNMHKFA
jgi:hypothetical protein